jgi:hypothetical protein
MQNHRITLLSNPDLLQIIGAHRLDLFLQKFATDLSSANLALPTADAEHPETFAELARALQNQPLPARLQETLLIIEQAALPEKADELAAAFNRHLPNVHLPASSPQLVRALELWLWSPDTVHELVAERSEAPDLRSTIRESSLARNDDSQFAIPHSPSAPASVLILPSSDVPFSVLGPPPSDPPLTSALCHRFTHRPPTPRLSQ